MPPIRGVRSTLRHKYARVDFSNVVRIINQLIFEDPSLVVAVKMKLTRTSEKSSMQTYFHLPVESVVVHGQTGDRSNSQKLG